MHGRRRNRDPAGRLTFPSRGAASIEVAPLSSDRSPNMTDCFAFQLDLRVVVTDQAEVMKAWEVLTRAAAGLGMGHWGVRARSVCAHFLPLRSGADHRWWPVVTAAEWKIPDPPEARVKAVRVVETGQRWNRIDADVEVFGGYWVVDNPVTVPPPQLLDWPGLLVHGRHLVECDPVGSHSESAS